MRERGKPWSEEEVTLALWLYYEIPTRFHIKTDERVKKLADIIGRSAGAVAFKLGNLKALDQTTEGVGLTHGAKMDKFVWDKYFNESTDLLMKRKDEILESRHILVSESPDEDSYSTSLSGDLDYGEEDNYSSVKIRKSQGSFRNVLLHNYGEKCCLSGVCKEEFLVASHIIPWRDSKEHRLDPRNGIILNVFLDKAFDKGFISIKKDDFTVMVSNKIEDGIIEKQLIRYSGMKMNLPANRDTAPKSEFLEYHNDEIFLR